MFFMRLGIVLETCCAQDWTVEEREALAYRNDSNCGYYPIALVMVSQVPCNGELGLGSSWDSPSSRIKI